MTSLAEVYAPIEALPVTPRPYGLFSVAPPADGSERWRVGVGAQSHNCMEAGIWQDVCVNGGADLPKEVSDWLCDVTTFDPFVVYLLATRTGIDAGVAKDELSAAFQAAEQRAVEAQLWAQIATTTNLGSQATPVGLLAAVEAALAENYNGLGVIHMSPWIATHLSEFLSSVGDRQYTKAAGTPVVVGAGYDSSTMSIGVTGGLFVRRGELTELDSWDLAVNDINALAERTYLVGWDCFAGFATLEAP